MHGIRSVWDAPNSLDLNHQFRFSLFFLRFPKHIVVCSKPGSGTGPVRGCIPTCGSYDPSLELYFNNMLLNSLWCARKAGFRIAMSNMTQDVHWQLLFWLYISGWEQDMAECELENSRANPKTRMASAHQMTWIGGIFWICLTPKK